MKQTAPFSTAPVAQSDWGGQYVSEALRKLMKERHSRQSMSPADNCYDNAVGESLFSRFKAELMQKDTFLSLEDTRTEIFDQGGRPLH